MEDKKWLQCDFDITCTPHSDHVLLPESQGGDQNDESCTGSVSAFLPHLCEAIPLFSFS